MPQGSEMQHIAKLPARNTAWKVRNTFIELDDERSDYSDSRGLRRSKSDSSLSMTSHSSQPLESLSSHDNTRHPEDGTGWSSADSLNKISRRPPHSPPHSDPYFREVLSSSDSRGVSTCDDTPNDGFEEDDVIDATNGFEDFPLDEALQVYQKIFDLVGEGADLRDVLSTDLAGVDITLYVPFNPLTGQPTSLGSVHHLVGSCTPCMFLSKQRCRKGMTCLHCHFEHHESGTASQKRPSKKNRLRIQLKRSKGKMVKESEERSESSDQQILHPCAKRVVLDGQDGRAIIDGERKSCQTYQYQPGTRISL